MFCGINSYKTYSNDVFQHCHSPKMVLPLVYCFADDTLFEVGPEIRCLDVCQVAILLLWKLRSWS